MFRIYLYTCLRVYSFTTEERIVVDFGEDGQLAADGRIQHFAARFLISVAGEGIADLGGVKVGQLPAEAFAEIARIEMVGIVARRDDSLVGVTLAGEVMVHADQDDLLETHVESQLQGHVGDGGALPDAAGHVVGKLRTRVGGVEEGQVIGQALKVAVGMPGQELGDRQGRDLAGALLDDEVVDGSKVGGSKFQFREHQVNAVHSKGELVFEFGQVGLFKARTVADDKAALACMDVTILVHSSAALAPPGMQVGIGHLRQTADGIVGVLDEVEDGGGGEAFEGLFHGF